MYAIRSYYAKKSWYQAVEEANELSIPDCKLSIQGYDADGEIIAAARQNASLAGVDTMIHFQQREVAALSHPNKYGFVITNPPYGERLEDKEALPALYRQIGESMKRLDTWSYYLITSYEDAQKHIGKQAVITSYSIHYTKLYDAIA